MYRIKGTRSPPYPVLRSVIRRQFVESSPTRPFQTTLHSNGRKPGDIRCSATSGDILFIASKDLQWNIYKTIHFINDRVTIHSYLKKYFYLSFFSWCLYPFQSQSRVLEPIPAEYESSWLHHKWMAGSLQGPTWGDLGIRYLVQRYPGGALKEINFIYIHTYFGSEKSNENNRYENRSYMIKPSEVYQVLTEYK